MNNELHLSLIIPVYNEYEGIPQLVEGLHEFFEHNAHLNAEVIFVDDGSADGSSARLSEMNHTAYKARLIRFSKNYGSHAALRAGIAQARGARICFNYADLQDPLEIMLPMMEKADAGKDIIWASREAVQVAFAEKVFSRAYAGLMKKFAFPNFPERGFDIVMFSQKVAQVINAHPEANSSIFLQILGLGFSQDSITYKKRQRKTGKSKWTFSKKMKLFIDSFVAFSYAPIRLVSIVGIFFFLTGIAWTVYLVLRKILFNDLQPGWPALASILLLGFGITNIALGIIAEYLWRTLDAARARPIYVIDTATDLN